MRKKKETSTGEPTIELNPASVPRRTKLIKKRIRASSQASTKEQTTPHLVSWGALYNHPDAHVSSLEGRIVVRAYERFLERGGHHGQDLEDWLHAEREVLTENQCSS